MTNCDPEFQRELERTSNEVALERQLAVISEETEIKELFERAAQHGNAYAQGYMDGFWAGRELLHKYLDAVSEAASRKHTALAQRWGLDKV